MVRCARHRASSLSGWTRVIVEKPFGRDLESSRGLTRSLRQYLSEDEIFRYTSSTIPTVCMVKYWVHWCWTHLMFLQNWPSLGRGAVWKPLSTSFFKSGIWAFMVQKLHKKCATNILWRFGDGGSRQVSLISSRAMWLSYMWTLPWSVASLCTSLCRYFDDYGIIRDILQNHLIHLLALFAMETPVSLDAEDIRNEKVARCFFYWIPCKEYRNQRREL